MALMVPTPKRPLRPPRISTVTGPIRHLLQVRRPAEKQEAAAELVVETRKTQQEPVSSGV